MHLLPKRYTRKLTAVHKHFRLVVLILLVSHNMSEAEEIGRVDTKFRFMSPDDYIAVDGFEDPKVEGVVCYLSRAQIGGYSGALGLAEDTSDGSIDCRQVGPIRFIEPLKHGEQVFRERRSLVFKNMRVKRFCDATHNTLVYLVYSEKLIDGSPQNSISAVPILPWPGGDQETVICSKED